MSKYQEVMDHIKVDDEMKKRILQNVEKQLEEAPKEVDISKSKVVPFRRYAAIAATFAVLLLGSYAVSQVTGGITNTSSSTSLYEPAMDAASEAPAMEEAASEAPAMEEAAEAPVMENEAAETAAEPSYSNKDEAPVKAEDSAQVNVPEQTEALEPAAAPVVSAEDELPILGSGRPIGSVVVTVLIAAFVLTAIIIFVIKRKR
ncbi:hypothetical protein [Butyrivibrio sp. NC2007]|uniref:hypothetical protein n=1 Tax=Butyrivibrio sp. NC2007 TaxID=1280683 RepID=UPI0003B5FD1F|nr:hypothetical protein [Butyrivibrio sp. NC2007]